MRIKTLFLLFGLILGIFIGSYLGSENIYVSYYNYSLPSDLLLNVSSNGSAAYLMVPAVDQDGNGVVTFLSVQAVPGSGKRLVNIDKILFWIDTQNSIRTASFVAQNITGINISKYDLIYTITANASVLEGSSAGAAITIATIAALEKKEPRKDVMITGTINHDGTLGPVGSVMEKAKAAQLSGAKLFLVPLGQSKQVIYKSKKYCENIGFTQICTVEQIPHRIDVEKETGIQVKQVKNIKEALQYFFGEEE